MGSMDHNVFILFAGRLYSFCIYIFDVLGTSIIFRFTDAYGCVVLAVNFFNTTCAKNSA